MKNISTRKLAAIIGGVIVVILAVIIISVSSDKNRKKQEADSKANVSVTRTDLKTDATLEQQTAKEQTDVEILFENKAVPVGTSLKVTALVTPDDDDKSIVWTSSDTNVFTVDKDGVITITGVGTATLTATVGSVSDAVVIEGIRNAAAGSDNGFSVYVPAAGGASSGSSSGNNSSTSSSGGSGSGNGSQVSGSTGGGTYSSGGSGSSGSTGTGSSSSGSSQNGGSVSDGSSGTGSSDDGTQSGGNTTGDSSSEDNNSSGSDSGEIADTIINNGFEQTVSNVYVCQQNGTYYGEIITQSNVTIIYIKKRNSDFDNRINNVIENLLPGNSQMVWNNYLSASTDRTFTVDGRMVRIVVATGGGHSQIVIYN